MRGLEGPCFLRRKGAMVGFRKNGLYGRQDIIRTREKDVGKRKERYRKIVKLCAKRTDKFLVTLAVWRGLW